MAEKEKKRKTSEAWLTLGYPDSLAENWKMKLAEVGLKAVISPLHDKDFKDDGSPDKPHYHIMLIWDGPTTENNAREIVEMIRGHGLQKCSSKSGSAQYFIHRGWPDKYQYDEKDFQIIGAVNVNRLLMSEDDEQVMLKEIYSFIRNNDCDSYCEFIDYCMEFKEEWFRLVTKKYRENIWKYQRSLEYDNKRRGQGYENNGSAEKSK